MPFDQITEQEITPEVFKTLSTNEKLLALADYLETLPPGTFDMKSWTYLSCSSTPQGFCYTPACICGHALYKFDREKFDKAAEEIFGPWRSFGASLLGLGDETAAKLFTSENCGDQTPETAAHMLRNYVLTGEVNWNAIR